MTRLEKQKYQDAEALRKAPARLEGKKFRLDCSHHVPFGRFLRNDLTILNGKELKIICSQCGH